LDIDNPAVFRELCRLDGDVSALEVSPDGHRVVVASYNATSKLIDFETGKIIAEIEPRSILSVAFAPDGKTFATGDAYGAIEIRQTTDAKLLTTLTGNAGHMTALTYAPDGLRLASASGEGVIRLWDSKTVEQVLAIRTGAPETSFLAFTPEGNTLMSYGAGTRIQLWEAAPR